MKIVKNLLVLFVASFIVTACGGGSGGSGGGTKSDSGSGGSGGSVGVAFKGAISGGTVICYDKNGKELERTTTDSDGNFKLNKKCPDDGKLVVRGGTDKSTGEKIEELIASGDSSNITPVTTMQYISERYNIKLSDTDSKDLVKDSKNNNPSDKTNQKSKKLVKMGLVLHSMTKNLQQQSGENLSYEEAMKIMTQKMQSKRIKDLADDSKKSEAKKLIKDVFADLEIDTSADNENKKSIEKIIDESTDELQKKDLKENGLKDWVPPSFREKLPLRYVIVTEEQIDGINYKLKFERNPKYTKIDDLEYKCKIFTKPYKAYFTYRSNWSDGKNVACNIDKQFTIENRFVNAGKFLVIKYSKKDSSSTTYGYSVPHKIGSMASYGNTDEVIFDNRVYLPIAGSTNAYVEKTYVSPAVLDTTSSDAVTSSNFSAKDLKTGKIGYLPVGFYYKPRQAPTGRFPSVAFGVKLTIGSKDVVMMVDRLYVAENSIKSTSASTSATNPYLHGIGSTSDKTLYRSLYNYYNVNGIYSRHLLDDLNRVDYNIKTGFLRFKAPTANGDVLKINDQSALTGDLIGVSLADICNRPIPVILGKGTICDYIRSTINSEQATQVTITPFIKATKRGSGTRGENIFKTSENTINIRGIKDFRTFPPLVIKGKPVSKDRLIPGKSGLKGIDSDGDGVSDGDEMLLNRDPFSSVDINKDTDQDGLTDLEEIKLGMRPNYKLDNVVYYVTPLSVKISKDDTFKFIVGSNRLGSNVKRYFSISLEGGADKVVEDLSKVTHLPNPEDIKTAGRSVATNTDIVFEGNTTTHHIRVKIKKNFGAGINEPKIVITPKISKINGSNEMVLTAKTKKILLESDDFSKAPKPDSVTLSYKVSTSGSVLDLNKSPLMVGAEITAIPNDSDKPVGATDKFKWQNSNYGNNWSDISDATTSKYVIKSSDEAKFIRVKVAYLESSKTTPDWYAFAKAIVKNSNGNTIAVKPATPTMKPTLVSDEASNTKFYPGSTMTITGVVEKAGYYTLYNWKLNGKNMPYLTGRFGDIFKSLRPVPSTPVGQRFKACYAYMKNRSKSDYICSDEITLEKRPAVGGKIRSISFKSGASLSSPTITKLTTNAGRWTRLDYALNDATTVVPEVFVLVELPSALKSIVTTNGASLILTNGTDDIRASAYNYYSFSDTDVNNIFRTANKSVAVFKLDRKRELKSGKTYTVKSVTIPGTSYDLPTTKPTLPIEFTGWGTNNGPFIDNNPRPHRKLVGDRLIGVDTLVAGISKSYQWQISSYDKAKGCGYDTNTNWTDIASATSNTYVIKLADKGKCIRPTVALQIDGKPTPKVYKAFLGASSSIALVEPETPTTPPKLTSSETDNTKFHRDSTVTMNIPSTTPYVVAGYKWKDNNNLGSTFGFISSATSSTYQIPTDFKIGGKILGCYAQKLAGSDVVSDYKCMAEAEAKTIISK